MAWEAPSASWLCPSHCSVTRCDDQEQSPSLRIRYLRRRRRLVFRLFRPLALGGDQALVGLLLFAQSLLAYFQELFDTRMAPLTTLLILAPTPAALCGR